MGAENSSGVHKSSYPDVDIPRVSVPEFCLTQWEENHGDKVAAVQGAEAITYKALLVKIRCFASAISKDFGLGKGSILALDAPNSIEWIIAFHGALLAGVAVTTINPAYTSAEITHQFEDSKPSVVVTCQSSEAKVWEAASAVPSIKHVVVIAPEGAVLRDGGIAFHKLVAGGSSDFMGPMVSHSDVAVLPYSSGTTGTAKGVILTHFNLVANCCQSVAALTEAR